MRALSFTILAYIALPILTLYSCYATIYLFDFRDPEFLSYLILWVPGIFLYYIYISQLVIGQRLPFLDRIWGFPNLVRKHQGFFRYLLLATLAIHATVHIVEDGIDKILFHPDIGMVVVYISIAGTFVLMAVAVKIWLKPRVNKMEKSASYAKMHRLHQVFYLLAVGVWFHVVSAGAFEDNILGQSLVTGYLVFALACKLYLLIGQETAPVYRLESIEVLHENFVRLRLRSPKVQAGRKVGRRVEALHRHEAGQYAYFSFAVEDQRGKTYWEQHPFSFAGYALEDSNDYSSVLTVVVKKLGDFTARLPEFPPDTKVKVLGPYGKFSYKDGGYANGVHLIAAGVGITPFLSMLEQKASEAALAGEQEDSPTSHLTLHWFVHEESELVFEDRFRLFRDNLPNVKIQTYVGKRLSEEILQEVLSSGPVGRKTGVLYCGPGAVGPVVRKVMNKLGIPKSNFHTELFSM
ncbi:hypothetical protein P0082_04750 [Candidatus Haliotispira prima]|uniref:FAD-binding FR-type domain-containing protein n=1 Tax=Candidatus Haliotispira prima TaxID=3034016 RepID=A0ABY8MJZ4_9SPIO|nr:hypothetical protein P0082_04750 [Candidatus Haliotispira prima]